jgi:CheY-like chemotaxis protein
MSKVLIIDDSSSSRALLKGILAGIGVTTCEAADGEEGLRVLRAERPIDLVLLDWHMDKMDGPAFLTVAPTPTCSPPAS